MSEPTQLEFLRLLSDRASQRIKYNCKDSVAWGDKNNEFSKSIKIKADNGVEMHADSSNKFKPKLILDGCSVRNKFYAVLIISALISGLSLLLVLVLALRGFSLCTPVFPSPKKTNTSKFQLDVESVPNEWSVLNTLTLK